MQILLCFHSDMHMACIGVQNKKHDLNMNEVQELLKLIQE